MKITPLALLCFWLNGTLVAQTAPSLTSTLPLANNPTVQEPAQPVQPAPTFARAAALGKRMPEGAAVTQTDWAKLCEQQRLKIQALEKDRQTMTRELQRLKDGIEQRDREIRELKETLAEIQRRGGGGKPTPDPWMKEPPVRILKE
jgi:hypothetical protein